MDEGAPPFVAPRVPYALTRGALLRSLGFIYAVAFLILARQGPGLLGSRGILPVRDFLDTLRSVVGAAAVWKLPSLFWLGASDGALEGAWYLGLALSLIVMAGFGNALVLGVLWLLYESFVHVGQVFYGYGWEMLLLESGFLAIFLAPPGNPRAPSRPPAVVIVLFRWVVFRLMFGAGLIKLRGDPCWTALTCLQDHFETQPNPHPLSPWFASLPPAVLAGGVVMNHVAELVAPFGVFGPRRVRLAAGTVIILFQATLILSGNLAFLNWLTIVAAIACFDDDFVLRLVPARFRARLRERSRAACAAPESRPRRWSLHGLAVVIALLSIGPTVNLLSSRQLMNASFEPFGLVNTYGAFGSIEHERHEVVLEGTADDPNAGPAEWKEYGFYCKPSAPSRPHCLVAPYHLRLDWQMWFAGLSNLGREPWLLKLTYELLSGNETVAALLAVDPFHDRPPRYVRASLYRYWFPKDGAALYWEREYLEEYFRPVSRDDPALLAFLRAHHWRVRP